MDKVAQLGLNNSNGILKNAAIAVPLKSLSNFWRSLEMTLINCKVKLKLKGNKILSFSCSWCYYCSWCNIIFTIKDTKLYVLLYDVTLSRKDDQKLSKFFSKRFESSVNWNEHKMKTY